MTEIIEIFQHLIIVKKRATSIEIGTVCLKLRVKYLSTNLRIDHCTGSIYFHVLYNYSSCTTLHSEYNHTVYARAPPSLADETDDATSLVCIC